MAESVLLNRRIFFGGYDLTGDSNSVVFSTEADAPEDTSFEDTSRSRLVGLESHALQANGQFNASRSDPALFTSMGAGEQLVTLGAEAGAAAGSTAYFFKALSGEYSPGGAVGDVKPFSFSAVGTGDVYRGILIAHETGLSSSGQSAGFQLGAVSAAQLVAAILHVIAVDDPGDGLTVTLESDDNASFTSATTRATFTSFSAIGAELKTVAGAITDDYWRITWTITGSTPSFTLAAAVAIQ